MTLAEFDLWARDALEFHEIDSLDISMNGIQLGDGKRVLRKIAFAVDACMETFLKASELGADLLFVHHGLFWGSPLAITGLHGRRVRALIEMDLGLYACHLPLDRHAASGNNGRMAQILGLLDQLPFGEYRGKAIGMKGRFESPHSVSWIVETLFGSWDKTIQSLEFGPKDVSTVGMVSGGGTREFSQAMDQNLDLYITGDASHQIYHHAREAGINVLFAGHYLTEVFGVKAMADRVVDELGLETVFIDVPTGL